MLRRSSSSFAVMLVMAVSGLAPVPAHAQPAATEGAPFRSEWVVIGGAGRSVGSGERAGREQAFQAIEWGRTVSGEHGSGVLRGRLEMVIELTPVFVAFQSNRAEGAGISPLMFRWNLRDRGPVEAVRAAAVASGARVRVEAAPTRGGEDADAAVYDCCVALIANVAEHAGPEARATVRLWQEHDAVRFEVADDGVGFDPGAARRDGGLARAADVVGALGGSLEVDSRPGHGARVAGSVPVAS